jgi:aspartyl aminopeptidase
MQGIWSVTTKEGTRMTDKPVKSDKPFNRLTHLCAHMTEALESAIEAETGEDLTPVKTIVFLEDEKGAGIQTFGYTDSIEAMTALFIHMKAIFEAEGKTLDFVGVNIPDSPEGVDDRG